MSSSSSSNGHHHFQNRPSTSTSTELSIHSCEICGQSGFTDDKMLEHTEKCHVEGKSECPFCGMTDASSAAELLLHVNQAHLDYLTPENELMSFIDDSKSPSGEDSDSVSSINSSSTLTHNFVNSLFSMSDVLRPLTFNYRDSSRNR